MSKRVLILSASPRKGGNSDTLCDQFALGAQEAGHDVEMIRLRDHHIGYCSGCGVCNRTHRCVQKDDMADILDKMVKADVLVMATPLTVREAKLKQLIDRFDHEGQVDLLPMPELVAFAESEEFTGGRVRDYIARSLSPFKLEEYSDLVLGCTHFNYFKDSFHQLLPHVHLLDGNRGTINYLMKNIELENLESSVEYYYSAKRVSGEELKRIERYLERLKNMKDIGI